ncbi:MAG: glycosyl hydrolase [Acidobacteriota bacterium]|nr:glycosyl hydrolase [Acidobacteriota bacterium]
MKKLPVLVCVLAVLGSVAAAQGVKSTPPETKDPLAALKYRTIGPAAGGRVSRVAGIAGDPSTYYAATASGGVWKSVNGGATWTPIFDDQPISSIGSIAVAPSDPNVVYVGSGEANIRGNVAAGNGIYKSIDAGKTWTHVWKQEGQIGTMAVHPKNADIAFAAVLGHAFGPNPERGVYRTKDGGRTWQQVLKKDDKAGASDVAVDPNNPNVIFAGFWQARRTPWDMTSGGPGSGLHVSRDGGDTWKQLTGSGLPDGIWGKVGVAIAPSDSSRVYAIIEAEKGGLYRSDDGGENWTRASGHRALTQRAWYYSTITVDPKSPNDVWVPQVPMLRSIDGGRTIKEVRGGHHGDYHDLWIDPLNTKRMINANDGGVDISVDGGATWYAPRLPISQFYHVSVDNRMPYRISGAMQDLGTAQIPSNSLETQGITSAHWYDVGGGEAGHVVSKSDDPDIVYAGEYLGIITRYDHRTKQARHVGAWPENMSGHGGEDMKYRFQWTAPIAPSPHDPNVIYHAAQVLFRSTDGGQSWTVISPDLTTNDKERQKWSGGPITGDNTGVETWTTIFAVAESPREKGLIWAGSDDGLVHVTRNGGAAWTNVTAKISGLPRDGTVSLIEPSPHDAATAYVVVDAHRLDDMKPYLFKTSDYGQTWRRLDGGLDTGVYLHAVREDPKRRGVLYLGTERGVMVSFDDGKAWRPLKLNMPTVAVHDLAVKDDSLVVGTHGRSIWVLDDLQPVREMSAAIESAPAHLFAPARATRWAYTSGNAERPAGQNPPAGAIIHYWLKDDVKTPLTLEIVDAKGAVVRTLSSEPKPWDGVDDFEPVEKAVGALPAERGIRRAVWDFRHEGADIVQGAKIDWGNPGRGPLAVPGTYTVRLKGAGIDLSQPLIVTNDPRSTASQADLEAQLAMALQVRDAFSRVTRIVSDLRGVRSQLEARAAAIKAQPLAADLVKAIGTAVTKINDLEGRIHNPTAEVSYDILAMRGGTRLYSRISPLIGFASAGDGAPTQGVRDVSADQMKELAAFEAEARAIFSIDVAAINALAAKLGLTFVMTPR